MAQHDAGDRYSYFYRGSNQVLDNIFISNNMAAKARFEPVHINASFMKEHGRASDHDPVLVQIDFSGAQTPGTPTDDQQGNTVQATDQNSPSSSNTGSQLVLIRPKLMNKRVQHLKAKRRARTKMRSKTTRKRQQQKRRHQASGKSFHQLDKKQAI